MEVCLDLVVEVVAVLVKGLVVLVRPGPKVDVQNSIGKDVRLDVGGVDRSAQRVGRVPQPRRGCMTHHNDMRSMVNSAIADLAKWAESQGWTGNVDTKGYTRFYDVHGNYIAHYPATPSNPRRRMADLHVALRKAVLQVPPPSKKEQRVQRRKERGR